MDEGQQERFMGLRKQHLNKLRSIYQERQDLNMQVSPPLQHAVQQCIPEMPTSCVLALCTPASGHLPFAVAFVVIWSTS